MAIGDKSLVPASLNKLMLDREFGKPSYLKSLKTMTGASIINRWKSATISTIIDKDDEAMTSNEERNGTAAVVEPETSSASIVGRWKALKGGPHVALTLKAPNPVSGGNGDVNISVPKE